MIDPYKIYNRAARLALTELCWRTLNGAAGKIPLAERELKQRRVLIFGDDGDVRKLDGLQDIIPLYDEIAEHDAAVATALENWVKANAPPRPWAPKEPPKFRKGEKVIVGSSASHPSLRGRKGYVTETKHLGGTMEHKTVWVQFGLGESPVYFPEYQLEAA